MTNLMGGASIVASSGDAHFCGNTAFAVPYRWRPESHAAQRWHIGAGCIPDQSLRDVLPENGLDN